MRHAVARFSRRALLALVATVIAAAAIAVAVVTLLGTPVSTIGYGTGYGPLVAVIAVVLMLLGLGGASIWNGIGIVCVRKLKPDSLVFLARREPSLAPDLPLYLHRKDLSIDVSDRWILAVIDDRGLAAWSGGFWPRELVMMEWSELGEIVATDFRTPEGQQKFGITVDVRPFPTPLIVRVGYSTFGLQAAFDREGTVAVAEAVNGKRPLAARPSL